MLSFVRVFKFTTILAVAAAILVGAPTLSYAKTGKVRLNIVKAGFIIGRRRRLWHIGLWR